MAFFRTLVLSLLLASTLSIVACNTFKGFGRDVEKGGQHIEHGATKTQQELKK